MRQDLIGQRGVLRGLPRVERQRRGLLQLADAEQVGLAHRLARGLRRRGGGAVPTRVTAVLLDGQRISREIDHAPGFAARPMNRDEVERKFRGNVGQHWEKDRTDKILQALWALERTNNVSSLLAELALPA